MERGGGGSRVPCPICGGNKRYSNGTRNGLLQHMMRVHPDPVPVPGEPANRDQRNKPGKNKKEVLPPKLATDLLMKELAFRGLTGTTATRAQPTRWLKTTHGREGEKRGMMWASLTGREEE
jgi:hypothetical protein